jgi:hypothetical protein
MNCSNDYYRNLQSCGSQYGGKDEEWDEAESAESDFYRSHQVGSLNNRSEKVKNLRVDDSDESGSYRLGKFHVTPA